MNTRYESPPIPNLPDYALGEKLGAGSYGKQPLVVFSIFVSYDGSVLGTVYKARLTSVC